MNDRSALGHSYRHMLHLIDLISARGRGIFGLAIAALGVEHLLCAHVSEQPFPEQFHASVIPVIPWIPASPGLAYLTGIALLLAGGCIGLKVRARVGALLLSGILLGCALILHLQRVIAVPQDWGMRGELCEMLALASAALVVTGSPAFAQAGRVLFGISAVVFGVDHFLALDLIASLIPAWMPGHILLASLTGAAMVAAGVSLLFRRIDRLAAFGLGMIFLVFVLTLHLPRVLAAPRSPDEWSSALIALAMCGASWIWASATPVSAPP